MPRQSQIKWRKSDEQELKRLVRNFNAKISRIVKKDPSLAEYMPNRIKVAEVKNNIETRQDFNRELNSMKRFLKRGNEDIVISKGGIKTTKWEKNEVAIQVATINRRRTVKRKALEELEATSRGESLGMTRKQMNSIRLNELNPKTFNFDKISKYEWEKYKANVYRQSRPNFQDEADVSLRKNYIRGLYEVFGETDEVKDLINQIESMSIKDFIEQFYKEQEATIDFIYDPIEQSKKLDILMHDVWVNTDGEYEDKVEAVNKVKKKYKVKKKTKKKRS